MPLMQMWHPLQYRPRGRPGQDPSAADLVGGWVHPAIHRISHGQGIQIWQWPRPGRLYAFTRFVATRGSLRHVEGDLLLVAEATDECPHGEVGPFWHNWICLTLQGRSVWSTLEGCIESGALRPVRDLTPDEVGTWVVMTT